MADPTDRLHRLESTLTSVHATQQELFRVSNENREALRQTLDALQRVVDGQTATNVRLETIEQITAALSKSVLGQNKRHDAMAADIAEIKRRLEHAGIPAV